MNTNNLLRRWTIHGRGALCKRLAEYIQRRREWPVPQASREAGFQEAPTGQPFAEKGSADLPDTFRKGTVYHEPPAHPQSMKMHGLTDLRGRLAACILEAGRLLSSGSYGAGARFTPEGARGLERPCRAAKAGRPFFSW